MRIVCVFFLLIIVFAKNAIAYPEEQLKACILGSKQSPVLLGVPDKTVENYCDCSLKLIVDKGKELKQSINKCGLENFG